MNTSRRRFVTGCATCAVLMEMPWASADGVAARETIKGPGFTLSYVGRMRDIIMSGKREGVLSLRQLHHSGRPYGLGPLAGLHGEVTMLDGRITLSEVKPERRVQTRQADDATVPFFVWADVQAWRAESLPNAFSNLEELASLVGAAGARRAMGDAFPFLITGKFSSLNFHIVDAKADAPAGMEAHKKMQVPFELSNVTATLVGFWSTRHQGTFTQIGSNVHVHFVTDDGNFAGHVENVAAAGEASLLELPASS
jgi:acetolactate decarboxylase